MKLERSFGFSRGSGILMPVSSLPSRYGIGSCGKEAFKFVDFLAETGVKVWQVLPLNPTSYGDSPYQSPSAWAGNPYFVDLDLLREDGLLTASELKSQKHDTKTIDYGWLFENRYQALRTAYSRFVTGLKYFEFVEQNAYWLDDYALYMALKVKNGFKSFVEWDENERDYNKAKENIKEYKKEIAFWKFVQFEFFKQWSAVLDYAHQKGVSVLGDIPIYVAYDSVDVWSNRENYLLDENLAPKLVAGCPPDAFSADGQLWG
ncbi:MAG: 4-alpha-glucanotransferase, partial [Clostridia bacterium]|nr:4-alpha-glucanotransferase [Clostridia bacterium]